MNPIKPEPIEEALAQCLDGLERGEFPIEEYLSHYPPYEKELHELLALIGPLNSLQQLSPRNKFVENAGQKLISKLPDRNVTFQRRIRHFWQKPFQLPRRRFSMVQIFIALVFMVSVVVGGTAYAADAAEPGDLLYGLDLALEKVQLDLAPDAEAAAAIHLEHAAERLLEVQNRLGDGEIDNAIIALDSYGEVISSLTQLIASAESADQEALTEMLNAALEIHQEVLTNLIANEIVPEQAWEAIEKAIDASTPPVDITDVPPVDVPPVDIPDVPPVDIPDDPPVDVPPDDIPDAPPVDVEPPGDIPDVPPEDAAPPEDIPAGPPGGVEPPEEAEIPEEIPDTPPESSGGRP